MPDSEFVAALSQMADTDQCLKNGLICFACQDRIRSLVAGEFFMLHALQGTYHRPVIVWSVLVRFCNTCPKLPIIERLQRHSEPAPSTGLTTSYHRILVCIHNPRFLDLHNIQQNGHNPGVDDFDELTGHTRNNSFYWSWTILQSYLEFMQHQHSIGSDTAPKIAIPRPKRNDLIPAEKKDEIQRDPRVTRAVSALLCMPSLYVRWRSRSWLSFWYAYH